MDYYQIGQRIRKIRKAKGRSQETLAEKIGISTTHMIHIETANTKLNLPVFVAIAEALEVQADTLLNDAPSYSIDTSVQDIIETMHGCTSQQARVITDLVRTVKTSLDTHY